MFIIEKQFENNDKKKKGLKIDEFVRVMLHHLEFDKNYPSKED